MEASGLGQETEIDRMAHEAESYGDDDEDEREIPTS